MEIIKKIISNISWENMAPGTEFARDFCAGIGPLQLGGVLVIIIISIISIIIINTIIIIIIIVVIVIIIIVVVAVL